MSDAVDSSQSGQVKDWLYKWLASNKRPQPSFTIQPMGGRGRARFKCEIRVTDIAYIGVGNSTSKKDAQANAAYDFAQYLIRSEILHPKDFPFKAPVQVDAQAQHNLQHTGQSSPWPQQQQQQQSLPGGLRPPHAMKNEGGGNFAGYGRFGAGASSQGANLAQWNQQREQQREQAQKDQVERAEQVDLNADLHGGWTVENGKKKLNEWCQQIKVRAPEPKYHATGPDNQRSFYAELSLYVPQLRRQIFAREHGSNKKVSSSAAALSIVRQLFHLGVIEAFTGVTTVKKSETEFPPIPGKLEESVAAELDRAVIALGLDRQDISKDGSLVVNSATAFEPQEKPPQGCIPWCPPVANWDPWRGGNIEDGIYFNQDANFINQDILQRTAQSHPNETTVQKRRELPIFAERRRLLDVIAKNPVVIVKGETGSGKTTQLGQ